MAMTAVPRDASLNSADHAYFALRDRILAGGIKPGDVLKERELCDELSVSRTPVREALRRLSADGLVETRPRRSIIVTSFADNELGEIFELGIVLESFVAALAAEKATAEDRVRLEAILAQMETLIGARQYRAEDYVELDQAFHDQIAIMARNPRIYQILRQTMSFRLLANIFGRYEHDDFVTSLAQHHTIVRAISSGDPDWARSAMASHVRTGQAAQRQNRERSSGIPVVA